MSVPLSIPLWLPLAAALAGIVLPRILARALLLGAMALVFGWAIAVLAGYAFAVLEFPGKRPLFYVVLLGLIVPIPMMLIPEFICWKITRPPYLSYSDLSSSHCFTNPLAIPRSAIASTGRHPSK